MKKSRYVDAGDFFVVEFNEYYWKTIAIIENRWMYYESDG